MKDIKLITESSPYQQYLYSYPHKTSYRPLAEHWSGTNALPEGLALCSINDSVS